MSNHARRYQTAIGIGLFGLMAITRGHHTISAYHLPDASWAVFFLAGALLRTRLSLVVLLTLAVVLDYTAITFAAVSNFCVTPAYTWLIPAYASLWLAGRWSATQEQQSLLKLTNSLLLGTLVCELISSGSFYLLSGYFQPTLIDFATREMRFLPHSIMITFAYTGIALSLASLPKLALLIKK